MPAKTTTKKKKISPSTQHHPLSKIFLFLIAVVLGYGAFSLSRIQQTIPPEIRNSSKLWPMANQNYANTREAVNSSINSENIGDLEVAWSVPLTGVGTWGSAATNPLVLDNTVYIQDLKSNVYAIDFTTGALKWKKEYNLDAYGPNGPAIAYNKVFIQKGHYDIAALDLSGNELWTTNLSLIKNIGIDIQITAFDNKIYVSTVPGTSNENFYTGGGVGVIYALDQSTGKIVWSFNTVDSSDIWGNPTVNSGGGAWYPPAVDVNTGLLYFGIGNPAPWPGTKEFPNGTSRPGPNLYTNSLVALNSTSGRLAWYNQVSPHDLFDLDFQNSPILIKDEQNRSLAIGSGKVGKIVAFDTDTRSIVWETKVGKHQNDDLTVLPKGTTRVYPGPLGGIETPMAYSNGVVFAPIVNLFADYTPTGLVIDTFDLTKGTGELTAVDVRDGSVLWTQIFPTMNVGGATVVNDLVITSTYDGTIYALNKDTGVIVWEQKIPDASINASPAIVGDTLLMPIGSGKPARLTAFRLGVATK